MADGAVLRFSPGQGQPLRGLDGSLEDVDAPGQGLLALVPNFTGSVMKVPGGWQYKDGTIWPTLNALRAHLLGTPPPLEGRRPVVVP